MFDHFQAKICTGGQYISFERKVCGRKRTRKIKASNAAWRTCGSSNNIHYVMKGSGSKASGSTEVMSETSSVFRASLSSNSSQLTQHLYQEPLAPVDMMEASSHGLINATRRRRNSDFPPLQRSQDLDVLAKKQADLMAAQECVSHSEPKWLLSGLEQQGPLSTTTRRLGENVVRGNSSMNMHVKMLDNAANYANLIDGRYTECGLGQALGPNGKYYMCLLFRG